MRTLSDLIPARWRAAVLLLGTIVFFPVIILVIMVDAVTDDMPRFRFFVNRTGQLLTAGMQKMLRIPSVWQNVWRMPDLDRREASAAQ